MINETLLQFDKKHNYLVSIKRYLMEFILGRWQLKNYLIKNIII